MAVGRHLDGVMREPKFGHQFAHFVQCECGAERFAEEFALIGRGVAGIGGDQMVRVEIRRVAGPGRDGRAVRQER